MTRYQSMALHDDLVRSSNHLREFLRNEEFDELSDCSKDHLNSAKISIDNVVAFIKKVERF